MSLSGVVAGASLLAATALTQDTTEPEVVVDTTATFEDTNGNGIDDDCEEAVVADPTAEAAAEAAVDADADGVISVSEAAHSDRVGGKNCNHGGYVSGVAHGDEACEGPATTDPVTTDPATTDPTVTEAVVEVTEPEVDEPDGDAPATCEPATDEDVDEADRCWRRDRRRRRGQGGRQGSQGSSQGSQEGRPRCRQGRAQRREGRAEGGA